MGVGYDARFGIVTSTSESQRRIPKRSASFYRQVAQANALESDGENGLRQGMTMEFGYFDDERRE